MNKKLFDDLYYGDYRPNSITLNSDEYRKLVSQIIKSQDTLKSKLSNSDYKLVTTICNNYNKLHDLYSRQSYSDGIKFATNFLFLALNSDN